MGDDVYDDPEVADALFGEGAEGEAFFYDSLFQSHDLQLGCNILELACGTGRVARRLTELGWQLTALDSSPVMLRPLKKVSEKNLHTICADMRNFQLPVAASAAYCNGGSFGLLYEEGDRKAHLKAVCKNLNPHGYYFMDVSLIDKGTRPFDYSEVDLTIQFGEGKIRASKGRVEVYDGMGALLKNLKWETPPLEFNISEFEQLVRSTGRFKIQCVYPQCEETDSGYPVFMADVTQKKLSTGRVVVALKKTL